MKWQDQFRDKLRTPEEAAKLVKSGDRVVVRMLLHPSTLCNALAKRRGELKNVTVFSHWVEDFPWFQRGWEDSFLVQSGFIARPVRDGHKEKRFDFLPSVFGLSDGVRHKEPMRGAIYSDADVALVKVGPPDENGWSSFGHDVWWTPTAIRSAKTVIAEVSSSLIRTYGDHVHVSDLDYLVEGPPEERAAGVATPKPPEDEASLAEVMGACAAGLIRDGDALQIGLGSPSEAVMQFLGDKNDLGVYSELTFAHLLDLVKAGVVTGKRNNIYPGKHIATSLYGYPGDPKFASALDYMNDNPIFELLDVTRICNLPRIASVDNMVAINTGIGIDLHGQANISHIGTTPLSGPGGQVEFAIGSHYSRGGRSILMLLSTAKGGTISRIVPQFDAGAVIYMPCYYVDYLVTEYGAVNLDCKSERARAEAIISVSHPDFRPELQKAARKMFYP